MKEPKIRFNGFEGEWEETTLAELGKFYSGIGFPENEQGGKVGIPFFKVSDMNNIGNEKVMQTSNNYVTYNQVKKNCWKICSDVPAIYFAKVGAAVLLNRKRLVLNQCLCDNNTLLYSFDKKVWDTWFCLSYFETIDLTKLVQVGTLPSCNSSMVGKIIISLPSLAEQQSIASFFTTLDAQISASTSRLASLKQIKAASLQAMFPQEGETVPKLRFKGFEGEWKTSLVGEVCKISTGKSNTQDKIEDGEFPFYVRSPYVERSNKYLYDEEAVLTVGDGVGTGKVFHYVNGKYDLHQRVYRMFDFHNIQAKYFYYLFSTQFYKRVMSMTAKSSVDSVRMDMIADMKINVPAISEQQSIASYFTNLDRQITLQTQRLEKLKQIKAACLDKMFV